MGKRDQTLRRGIGDHTVHVEISMSSRFLGKLDAHRERIHETNRSAWVRRACLHLMNEERDDLREEDL